MAALLLWVVFSYGVVLLTVVLRTLFMGPSGHLGPSAVLAGAMGLCVHAAAGYLVGRCWSAKVAPPLVAICAFGITLYGSGQYGSPWYVLFPVLIDVPDPFSAWQPGLYWRQLLWLSSLVALLVGVAFHAAWRSRALRVCVAVAAALAVLGGVLTWQLRGVYFQPGEPSFTYACRQDGIKVCVNPTFRAALPDLVTGFSDIAGNWTVRRVSSRAWSSGHVVWGAMRRPDSGPSTWTRSGPGGSARPARSSSRSSSTRTRAWTPTRTAIC